MDRIQVTVVAVVVAALALFGLKIWSERSSDDERVALADPSSIGDLESVHSGGDEHAAVRRGAGRQGKSDRLARLRGSEGRGGASTGRGGTSTEILRDGTGRRGGQVGTSGSRRSRAGQSGASAPSASGAQGRRLGGTGEKRSGLVEFLGAQDPTRPNLFGSRDVGDPEDVALEVKTTEDSDQATESRDIEDADFDEGIKFTEGSELRFPDAGNASGEAGTITFGIEPEWDGSDPTNNSLVQIRSEHQFNNRLELVKNGKYLRFILADNAGREADISVDITHWQQGDPHDVTASWGEERTSLFIDGQLVGTNTYSGSFDIASGTPMFLGSDHAGSNYVGANSTIRDFTLFNNTSHE